MDQSTEVRLLGQGPSEERKNKEGSYMDYMWAYQATVKAVVGTGVIALPYGCRSSGWLLAVIGMVVIAVISAHTMQLLVLCMRRVRALRVANTHDVMGAQSVSGEVTCSDVGYAAYGSWGKNFADVVLILCQLTGSMAFVSFITENFSSIMTDTPHKRTITLCAVTPALLMLTLLRSTSYLAPMASFGNVLFISSFIIILYFGFSQVDLEFDSVEAVRFSGFSKFFGVAIFAFAAHSEVMSIEQFLPIHVQRRYTQVIAAGMGTALVLFISFGMAGYLFFANNTDDDIFMNISCSDASMKCRTMSRHAANVLGDTVKGLTTTMVIFNFPYTMFGAVQSIEERIWGVHNEKHDQTAYLLSHQSPPSNISNKSHIHNGNTNVGVFSRLRNLIRFRFLGVFVDFQRAILRTLTVALVVVVAALVPSFGFLTAFSGCLTGILTFVLPPLFYLRLYREVLQCSSGGLRVKASLWGNALLMVLGVIVSIASIVQLLI